MKIILLLLFLHTLFYRRSNNLNCGLFGFVGEGPVNFDWIKIMGLMNQSRGEDSCGILLGDGDIEKRLGKFTDFMISADIDYEGLKNYKDHTIIGHVRARSSGVVSLDNCHPFDIKNKDGKTIVVLAHNGTLKSHTEILKKYNVDNKGINIDSQAIAHIIAKDPIKNTSVFGDYKGAGAFVMWFPKKKNTLYIFKGASKEYSNSKVTEERPLFYYIVDKQVYYSSLREPLYVIGGNDETVKEFPCNQLLEVKNGEIKVLKDIDRSGVDNLDSWYPWEERPKNNNYKSKNVSHHNANAYDTTSYYEDERDFHQGSAKSTSGFEIVKNPAKGRTKLAGPSRKSSTASSDNLILIGEAPYFNEKIHGSRVYFWRGRYYRNGHIINPQKSGEETKCSTLTLDNNGYDDLHPLVDTHRLEDVHFWDGIIIEDSNVEKVNELALQHKLFKNDAHNGAILDTLTLSNLTNCLVSNPATWYQDSKMNGSFMNGPYKARFGCPIVHTFTTGKLHSTDNSKLAEYNNVAKAKIEVTDESVKDASLDDGMILPAENEEDKKLDIELCLSTFIDAKEDLYRSSQELRKFAEEYEDAKILWIRMVGEVMYMEEFIDSLSKGRIGVNEVEYQAKKEYCLKRDNKKELIKV